MLPSQPQSDPSAPRFSILTRANLPGRAFSPSPLLPTSSTSKHRALASPPPSPPFRPQRILRSYQQLVLVLVSALVLLYYGAQSLRSWSSHGRAPSFVDHLPSIGVEVGFHEPSGYFGVLDPEIIALLNKPRDPLVDGLSELGLSADRTYHLGPKNSTAYLSTLHAFIRSSFPSHLHAPLARSLDIHFSSPPASSSSPNSSPPPSSFQPMVDSKNIWMTDKSRWDDVPGEWAQRNEGWSFEMLGDREADVWVAKALAPSAAGEPKSKLELGWEALSRGILKADTLRYLLLLIEGGVYSDTDTVCLKPISEWGRQPETFTPKERSANARIPSVDQPSIIIGIEADVGGRKDWHEWWPRPLQMVQWTIASSPHHPILLDVVRRILASSSRVAAWTAARDAKVVELEAAGRLEDAEKVRRLDVTETKAKEARKWGLKKGVSVMDWTGPGVWTDAVFSYLKARYDIDWVTLKDIRRPLVVGEVTILPVTGFSPGVGLFGSESIWDDQAMVDHKFNGRWKPEAQS